MLDKQSKKKLEQWMVDRQRNPGRLVYITKRYVEEWALKRWRDDGWENLHPDHLRLISIIGAESVNQNELAKRARVTKQAMSKMVATLEKYDFIDVAPDPKDSRAKVISVSKNGVDFLTYFNGCGKEMEKKFAAIIGEKKTTQLIDLLSELAEKIIELQNAELDEE